MEALKQPALSHAQAKRWTKQGARSFVMFVGAEKSVLPQHFSAFCGLDADALPALRLGDDDPPPMPEVPIVHPPGVQNLLNRYSDIFGPLPIGLPPVRGEGHVITLIEGSQPSFRPNFRMSPSEVAETTSQVKSLLAHGFIEQSVSPYAAPILFVTKKDGSIRMVFDYRALNTITKKTDILYLELRTCSTNSLVQNFSQHWTYNKGITRSESLIQIKKKLHLGRLWVLTSLRCLPLALQTPLPHFRQK